MSEEQNESELEEIADAIRENTKAITTLADQFKRFSALDRPVLEVKVTPDSSIEVKKE
jgi:hypothetical protein